MREEEDLELKAEIDEISERIKDILEKVAHLDPGKEEPGGSE